MPPEGTPGQAAGLPQIGQTLGGKYQIVRLLGEGGMAFVFEASHQRLQQRVAIKLLAPEFARDPELVTRFEREARAVARLRTNHVARVMDVDVTDKGIPYIVMEFLEGRDLDAELQARTRLPLGEAVDFVLQACGGMLEAHGIGIVHRDLKPANLFLASERDGNDRVVKVLDFGISKMVGESTRLTGSGAVMGTVLYMSPEQVRAQPGVDTRADIWALGVILYELLAGRAPWEGHSHQIAAAIVSKEPPDLRSLVHVPEGVAAAVKTMMQKEPALRFATIHQVLAALAPFAPPGSIGAGVAEQAAMGQSGARARVSSPPLVTHTIPMGSRPSVLDAAAASARAAGRPSGPPPVSTPSALPSATSSTALSASSPSFGAQGSQGSRPSMPPVSAGWRSRGRVVLVIAVVLGLLGAAGVVLAVVAFLRRPKPASPPPIADATSSAATPASPQPPEPPTVSSVEVKTAAPPATGTPGKPAPGGPVPPASGRRDGGAARHGAQPSATTSPLSLTDPAHLRSTRLRLLAASRPRWLSASKTQRRAREWTTTTTTRRGASWSAAARRCAKRRRRRDARKRRAA